MSLLIGVPAETLAGERRIPVVPDVVKKYQGLGASVLIQKGAGVPATTATPISPMSVLPTAPPRC